MSASGNSADRYPSRRVAWYTVFVLMICYTLSYCDRQILAFLVGPMKQELHISDTQVGLLQGIAFVFVYTVCGLPMGALADRVSRRNLVALGVVVWSVMTSLSSVARSFVSLAIARMGVGIGEATLSPCAFSMITDSFPKERLSSAMSVYTMGIQLGSGLALVIGGLVAQALSQMSPVELPLLGPIAAWRVTFLIVGLPGLLVALLLLTVREPPRQSVLLDSSGSVAKLDFRAVVEQLRLRWRTTVGLALIIGCQATCNYALLGWGPTFFDRIHHWPKSRTGLVLGLTTLGCGCLGLFVGGYLSDRWQREGVTDSALRVGLIGLTGVGLTLAPAMLLPDAAWTVALLIPAVFFIGLPIGCGYAAVQLIFPNQARGLVSAIVIFAVALIGLGFGSLLPGLLNDHLFHDELRIGASISITVVLAVVIGLSAGLATLAPYRRDYQTVHA
ncbi:MAG: major facilitator superfamily 1 [Gammaproteobacteria bacterium]|nr:major facilitator superfamily 1 [Gammaproteobacteria bacterium]